MSYLIDLADPALKQLLIGDDASKELDRDVFDVVLSDGRLKTKCILSPTLNHVVWCGQVARFDILQVRYCLFCGSLSMHIELL